MIQNISTASVSAMENTILRTCGPPETVSACLLISRRTMSLFLTYDQLVIINVPDDAKSSVSPAPGVDGHKPGLRYNSAGMHTQYSLTIKPPAAADSRRIFIISAARREFKVYLTHKSSLTSISQQSILHWC